MKQDRLYQKLLLMLLFACSMTEAQAYDNDEDPPLEYAYNHTIDFQLGTGANLTDYSQLPDEGVALFGHKSWGFELDFRYTQFFTRHWGAFAQLGFFSLGTSDGQLVNTLSNFYYHNGQKVLAPYDDWCGVFGNSYGSAYILSMVGAAYRYDIGRWSFRPRLGLGINWQGHPTSYYYIIDTNTPDLYEEVELHTENHAGHSRVVPGFAYSPSFQITFSTCSHFFLSAEMQWIGTIGHVYQHTIAKQWHTDEPQDWQPYEDYGYIINCPTHFIQTTDDHRDRLQMGNFIQFRFGIGWNIGWNRNEKRLNK